MRRRWWRGVVAYGLIPRGEAFDHCYTRICLGISAWITFSNCIRNSFGISIRSRFGISLSFCTGLSAGLWKGGGTGKSQYPGCEHELPHGWTTPPLKDALADALTDTLLSGTRGRRVEPVLTPCPRLTDAPSGCDKRALATTDQRSACTQAITELSGEGSN